MLREAPFWVLTLLPVIFLISVWDKIGDTVPMHYNLSGEADRWGSKSALFWTLLIVPVLLYVLLLVVPKIDPKQLLQQMGEKYYMIRFTITVMLSALFLLMVYSNAYNNDIFHASVYAIVGLLFLLLGNYMRNIKPNYFVGFRTPWTLENQSVWKLTHLHSSVVWVIGGLIMLMLNLWQGVPYIQYINMSIIGLLILDPIIYSYYKFQHFKKS